MICELDHCLRGDREIPDSELAAGLEIRGRQMWFHRDCAALVMRAMSRERVWDECRARPLLN